LIFEWPFYGEMVPSFFLSSSTLQVDSIESFFFGVSKRLMRQPMYIGKIEMHENWHYLLAKCAALYFITSLWVYYRVML